MSRKQQRKRGERINLCHVFEVVQRFYNCNWNDFFNSIPGFSDVSATARDNIRQGQRIDKRFVKLIEKAPHIDRAQLLDLESLPNEEILPVRSAENARPAIVTVISAKGGVGKTTISSNLAVELSTQCRVALVDADVYTMGATHKFRHWLSGFGKPLSFIALSIGEYVSVGRNPVSISAESPQVEESIGSLLFVPALISEHDETIDEKRLIPPVIVDWSISIATRAINRVVRQLSRLQLDVIVFDAHPGTLPLTQALCHVSDCCVLVTDDDIATMQANWMMAAEFQRRLLGIPGHSQTSRKSKSSSLDWFVAVNRIPNQAAAESCLERLKDAREEALQQWFSTDCPEEARSQVQNALGHCHPAFLLRDLYLINSLEHLPDVHESSPQSRLYLGGVAGILATRHLVRSLILDGPLLEFESRFLYAERDNLDARNALKSYLTHYPEIRTPTQGMMALTLLSWILVLGWILWLVNAPSIDPPLEIMFISGVLVILGVYAMAFVFRSAIDAIVWVVDLAATSGFWNLTFKEQIRQYNGKARLYRVARHEPFGAQGAWMFSLIAPGAMVGLLMLSQAETIYSTLTFMAALVIIIALFRNVPNKRRVLRMTLIGLLRMNSGNRWRDIFRISLGR